MGILVAFGVVKMSEVAWSGCCVKIFVGIFFPNISCLTKNLAYLCSRF